MKLIIGGDLVPTENNIELFNNGSIKELLGEKLLNIWNESEFKVFNLEVPLVDKKEYIKKSGPNLIAPISTIKGIKKLDPSLITLANNHILDQGEQGLVSTMKLLSENDIPFIGSGKTLRDAHRGYVLEKKGIKIGVYSCAEKEFTIATKNTAGANPFNPLDSLDHIKNLKKRCDYLVVLYHGGKEHYRYPSPNLQEICKKICDSGTNLVVCQHSHCIGSYEKYKTSTIVYGQGNFIFCKYNNSYWNNSLLIQIDLENNFKIEYIPIKKNGNMIVLGENKEKEKILFEFEKRSKEILQENFIEDKYKEFSKEMLNNYLYSFSGMNKWIRRVDKYLLKNWIFNSMFKDKNLLDIQNSIQCEAHRELLLQGIKDRIKGS